MYIYDDDYGQDGHEEDDDDVGGQDDHEDDDIDVKILQ